MGGFESRRRLLRAATRIQLSAFSLERTWLIADG
jgi:hypothetical protein